MTLSVNQKPFHLTFLSCVIREIKHHVFSRERQKSNSNCKLTVAVCCRTRCLIYLIPLFLRDNNECAVNNGGCSHHCLNFPGGFQCACPKGFRLESNKSCKGAVTRDNFFCKLVSQKTVLQVVRTMLHVTVVSG